MSDSDGKSEIALMEPIMASTLVSESGGELREKDHHSLKLSGEIRCRAFNLLDGYDPPRAYFATDCGTFYIILGEAQIASMVADGANILHKQIAQKK